LLATCNMAPGWSVRPQLFTYVCFAALILLLQRAFPDAADPNGRPRSRRALWLVPPLFAVWVNAHGGFVAGLAVLWLYLGCRSMGALHGRGREALGETAGNAAVAFAALLATFANPYGIRLLLWLV